MSRELYENGQPKTMLVDEVQDLTTTEVLMLSLFTRIREHEAHHFILAGDEFQTLNGNKFEWEQWINSLKFQASKIIEESKNFNNTFDLERESHMFKTLTHVKFGWYD